MMLEPGPKRNQPGMFFPFDFHRQRIFAQTQPFHEFREN